MIQARAEKRNREEKIAFKPRKRKFAAEKKMKASTIEALLEAERIESDPESKIYSSVDELFADLDRMQ